MFAHQPGDRGADGGVDGVLKFFPIYTGKKVQPAYAVVQVKGGAVKPNDVRALRQTVDDFDATAGVLVCFGQYMQTVLNNRSRATFHDDLGSYPVIQGLSVEDLLQDKPLDLPQYGRRRPSMLTV